MTEEARELVDELRRLVADLKEQSDAAWFPCHTDLKSPLQIAKEFAGITYFHQNRVSPGSVKSWIKDGWRSCRLRGLMFMGRWYTTDRWVRDFIREACLVPQNMATIANMKFLKRGSGQPKKKAKETTNA